MHKNSFLTGKHRPLWVFLLFVLCLFKANVGMADCEDWERSWCEISFNAEKGCLHYHVRYFQTWGALGSGNSGFAYTGYLNITQQSSKTHKIYIQGNEGDSFKSFKIDDEDYTDNKDKRSIKTTHEEYGSESKEYECYVDFDIPLENADVNKEKITVVLNGEWWKEGYTGCGSDIDVKGESYEIPTTVGKAEYGETKISYEQLDNNTPVVKLDWNRNVNGSVATYGDIYLCDENSKETTSIAGKKTEAESSNTSGTFYLNVTGKDSLNLNKEKKFKIWQIYKTSVGSITYETSSDPIVVDAYPQINDFNATFNPEELCIDLSWKLNNAPTSNVDDSGILLTVTKYNKNGVEVYTKNTTIAYTGGQIGYETSWPVESNDTASYKFLIRRAATSHLSAWRCFDRVQTVDVKTAHL